ncbi:histidinol dehydrogenase [Candidatus Poribacteria bacterium]|nr:histidinol dehydrogenase [Candidatus Poribacteria bacterium]MYG05131.1 histidinol dehydrogenase [Candidatus Poribacteria bacterium]MYK22226.1 histidinol dehydrogenase [Candidatus Poribacteria bacterium]
MLRIVQARTAEADDLLSKLKARGKLTDESILKVVRRTLSDVQTEGDKAVVRYVRKLDAPRMSVKELRVSREEIGEAYLEVPSEFIDAITHARTNIEKFHQKQLRTSWMSTEANGVLLGHLIRPLRRVGVCVPAISQLLVSSLLMNVIPATVAGVEEIAVCIPPMRSRDINAYMLVTASECGIQEIYKCGGAAAVAAMAYGTDTVAPVDKIVGPGNLYVQFAKKEVYGHVDIDKLAGPSEILVIADGTADPDYVAADLISQAEHRGDSAAILVTPSLGFAEQVKAAIEVQGESLPRREELAEAFENYGAAFIVDDIAEAVALANEIAPEHLELHVEAPFEWVGDVQNAGAILIGPYSPEAVGDYIAGPNHVLPTGTAARYASPLSVDDFLKKTSLISYTKSALKAVTPAVVRLAEVEGLEGHAAAMKIRFEED